MKPSETIAPDLILDIDPQAHPSVGPHLTDAPRIENETAPAPFNWRPTLLIVAFGLLTMLAVAYL